MKQLGFRGRLFGILLAFALIPSVLLSLAWGATSWWAFPLVGATAAWDSVAASGERAVHAAHQAPLTPAQRAVIDAHARTLSTSLLHARQASFVYQRAAGAVAALALGAVLLLGLVGSRVAGHLSRSLSRPLQELVGWTELIGRGDALPDTPPRRGAPEFQVLRERMRDMASELELGRARALEAERAAALRESARQVAHELKNPLTPIRFAVARLRRDAAPELQETIDVLTTETERLEAMAKSFSQFGRLPEGPVAEIDLGELARYTARSAVPPDMQLDVDVESDVPMVRGHYDALARAMTNVVLNAVEACRTSGGGVSVRVARYRGGREAVEVEVADKGCGIPPERLAHIWEPYVTYRAGGTGLGLAIVRQTVLAHAGSVHADSAPGQGTRIRMVLPVTGSRNAQENS